MILRRNEITTHKNYSQNKKLFAKSNFSLIRTMGGTTVRHIFLHIIVLLRLLFHVRVYEAFCRISSIWYNQINSFLFSMIERTIRIKMPNKIIWNIAIKSIPKSTNFFLLRQLLLLYFNYIWTKVIKKQWLKLRTFYYV